MSPPVFYFTLCSICVCAFRLMTFCASAMMASAIASLPSSRALRAARTRLVSCIWSAAQMSLSSSGWYCILTSGVCAMFILSVVKFASRLMRTKYIIFRCACQMFFVLDKSFRLCYNISGLLDAHCARW
ncbi:MAG: hypothetical protein [Microviridae sp.]|nr:MAG: hypothetical protein [Microviridae sp.]